MCESKKRQEKVKDDKDVFEYHATQYPTTSRGRVLSANIEQGFHSKNPDGMTLDRGARRRLSSAAKKDNLAMEGGQKTWLSGDSGNLKEGSESHYTLDVVHDDYGSHGNDSAFQQEDREHVNFK